MTPTPAQWFRTRPNALPDLRIRQNPEGAWEILWAIETDITTEDDAWQAHELTYREISTITEAAHSHDEYTDIPTQSVRSEL